MADINTSIKIGADASQAISEMQKLQSATDKLKQTGQDINIAPKVDANAVQNLKNTLSSAAVEVPVTVKTQVEGGGAVAGEQAAAAAATPMATAFAAEQRAAAGLMELNNQVAANSVENNIDVVRQKQKLLDINQRIEDAERDLADAMNELEDMDDILGGIVDVDPEAAAALDKINNDIRNLKDTLETFREEGGYVAAQLEKTVEATRKVAEAARNATPAMEGWRGSVNRALEAYKNFSTGASAGVGAFKSLSLNILADIELFKRTIIQSYQLGQQLQVLEKNFYSMFTASGRAAKGLEIFSDAFNAISASKPEDAVKAMSTELDTLNAKIAQYQEQGGALISQQIAQLFGAGETPEAIEAAKRLAETKLLNERKAAGAQKFKERQEELDKKNFELQKGLEQKRIALMDERAALEAKTALDISELEMKLKYEKDAAKKAAIEEEITLRKNAAAKELKDYDAEQKKKRDDAAKAEAERIRGIQDEARAAEIANLDERAKIEEGYLFDLDKINRRLAAAQTDEERNALIALGRARKAQRDREFKDYNDAQKKAMDENAAQMKEAARENAEYQKSLLEDLVGYQRQLVASFSGLQQSIFPKEAMNYLRQIAGASNRLPP